MGFPDTELRNALSDLLEDEDVAGLIETLRAAEEVLVYIRDRLLETALLRVQRRLLEREHQLDLFDGDGGHVP